jgi:cbb3-type cytochrome oxidase subunit 3
MKLYVIVVTLALALIGTLAYLYNRHLRKQEDAVAIFALTEIDRKDEACRKPYETEECKRYPIGCEIPLEGCKERKAAAEQEWALKYPRQAAQRQANILEEERHLDEKRMNKQP